jgi:tetratricopeptide (TPR) repeat protein
MMNYRNLLLGLALSSALMAADATVEQARKKIAEKKYDEAIAQLESANTAKPNAELKKTLAEAYLAKADSIMADQAAPPRMKYPNALHAYREVLKYDSANQKAKDQIAQIEAVYRSMGRPIPQ